MLMSRAPQNLSRSLHPVEMVAYPFEILQWSAIDVLDVHATVLHREEIDRITLPIDYRFVDLLLRAADVPEVGLGTFAQGARVGLGVRLPRFSALYPRNKKWRLAKQRGPEETIRRLLSLQTQWRVMKEARQIFPNLVFQSLSALLKDKPNGVFTARVFFDRTIRITVIHRTRTRNEERAPSATNLKTIWWNTFALTAGVSVRFPSLCTTGTCSGVKCTSTPLVRSEFRPLRVVGPESPQHWVVSRSASQVLRPVLGTFSSPMTITWRPEFRASAPL